MHCTALLLIAALLLKSVAGFAMAGCHIGHHPAESASEQVVSHAPLSDNDSAQLANAEPLDSTAALPHQADAPQPETTTKGLTSICSLCASCCVTATPAVDQSSSQPGPVTDPIPSPDFIDLSVLLSRATQPPKAS
ncbi:hypothetical protein QWY20_01480 [Alkalimonas sp. MEB108]|uniref:Secreted protein n=1 Tax=Alkalimonas cellulosilytica TaxID=3058395 RepID=A0ABU7J280_9GAMM|nr:hypothetical protein [Alkalimonas sp. MEB108]MEE2000110.1 hypothetical protein [Alkalimonas sp. MEB108]